MGAAMDQLESVRPPYRGAALLSAARESQGRLTNAFVAVTAGHAALSLSVHSSAGVDAATSNEPPPTPPAEVAAAAAAVPAAPSELDVPSQLHNGSPLQAQPVLRLTVLLDALPHGVSTPSNRQLAKFLTKILASSEQEVVQRQQEGAAGDLPAGRTGDVLGKDLPDMLVVEHIEEVVLSEFLCLDNQASGPPTAGSACVGEPGNLVYVCLEAHGLLQLWMWGAEGAGWRWSFLNSCNICACRHDPDDCRVLRATCAREPEELPRERSSRYRLVWEQEDTGDGAGLGLAFLPGSDDRPRRRVWARRLTFEMAIGSNSCESKQHFTPGEKANDEDSPERSEISLGFSVCLLATGVEALLCSRLGAWMPSGDRVFFNHFATGRLLETALPMTIPEAFTFGSNGNRRDDRSTGSVEGDARAEGDPLTDVESASDSGQASASGGSAGDDIGVERGDPGSSSRRNPNDYAASGTSNTPRLSFATLDSTGDLVVYEHPDALCVLSLPIGGADGGLRTKLQCTLQPCPKAAPMCFAVHDNVAVLFAGGVCSMYDLCTGRLLDTAPVPACPSCVVRRHRRRRLGALHRGSSCTCGRRRHAAGGGGVSSDLSLWVSRTRGHLIGVRTASDVLRLRLPGRAASLEAIVTTSLEAREGLLSAPDVLRGLREYMGLLGASGASLATLLPDIVRLQHRNDALGEKLRCSGIVDVVRQVLVAEERRRNFRGGKDSPVSSVPPWMLLASLSAASPEKAFFGANRVGTGKAGNAGGDPPKAQAVAVAELRSMTETRVAESLRALESVRALLQDPAGTSSRQASSRVHGSGRLTDDERSAADELGSLSTRVHPATALFESTLRRWMACRRGDPCDAAAGSFGDREARAWGMDAEEEQTLRKARPARDSEAGLQDVLAFAFRCEIADVGGAQDIAFLRYLLAGQDEPSASRRRGSAGGGMKGGAKQEVLSTTAPAEGGGAASSAASTFLCLHLVGNDASPLFEVACRALFKLRPAHLPRFVERLARFRAYAQGMREDHAAGTDDDYEAGTNDVLMSRAHAGPLDAMALERRASCGSDRDRRESDERSFHAAQPAGGPSPSSTLASKPVMHAEPPSPSSSRDHSRRASEDSTLEGAPYSRDGRSGREKMRTTSVGSSGGRIALNPLPEPYTPSGIRDDTSADSERALDKERRKGHSEVERTERHTAQMYFERALACLPPAADDETDGAPRRARLSLLMGARRFTEACKLLRDRAWDGPGGRWRGDRGAAEAWGASTRILAALGAIAAAEEDERMEDEEQQQQRQQQEPGQIDRAARAENYADVTNPLCPGYATASLQFRLAFEDALVEAILADSPDRMVGVMSCRPPDLTAIAVVRMVRQAATRVVTAADASPRLRDDAGVGGGEQAGEEGHRTNAASIGSTRTLKKCLLLLFEDEARIHAKPTGPLSLLQQSSQ